MRKYVIADCLLHINITGVIYLLESIALSPFLSAKSGCLSLCVGIKLIALLIANNDILSQLPC
jgi:hypothetical protein